MFNPAGGTTYNLNASISSTASTITLSSFLEPVSNVPYTMALLNTAIVYATISPKTTSSEFISFTGITQNADGTATLTGVTRGLQKKYPFTSDVTFKQPHSGQSQFILSDAPQVFVEYAALLNDNTFDGDNTFTNHSPTIPTESSSEIHRAASIEYANSLVIGAAPDASTTIKGISRISVAPVSPTVPISVGTNDPRVPTQDENDALVGTSGAPSSSNKYVTNADTAVTSTANKVPRGNASGLIDSSWLTPSIVNTLTAGESITDRNALVAGYYQADGGVLFDNKAITGGTYAAPVSLAITVGNHTNRTLIVLISVDSGTVTGVTYNGVAMTQVQLVSSGSNQTMAYRLFAPTVTSGSVQMTIAGTSKYTLAAFSYYNTNQSAIDSSNGNFYSFPASVITTADTVVAAGSVIASLATLYQAATATFGTSVNANTNTQSNTSTFIARAGDSGQVVPAGATSISWAVTGTPTIASVMSVAVAPVTAPSYGYVLKSSSSTQTNTAMLNKYQGFVGFALNAASAAGSVVVQTDGIVTGLSGLTPTALYYLANTAGTISTTPGTNTRVIGIALSTTTLLITNKP